MLTIFDEIILRRMVELRRRKDTALRHDPSSSTSPTDRLWGSPEHVIFSLARYVALLQHDGLSVPQALVQIDKADEPYSLAQYLVTVLARYRPDYLADGPKLLDGAAAIAQGFFAGAVLKPRGSYPPEDWLGARIEPHHFRQDYAEHLSPESVLCPQSSFEAQVADLAVRWQVGDELRSFSSPSRSWRLKVGSAGVALVRRGRPITHLLVWIS